MTTPSRKLQHTANASLTWGHTGPHGAIQGHIGSYRTIWDHTKPVAIGCKDDMDDAAIIMY